MEQTSLFIWILAAPGMKIVPTATGVVISQTAQVYQPHLIVQPAIPVKYIPSFSLFFFFQGCCTVISYTSLTIVSHWLQALPLAQQLEPKTQTGQGSSTDAASVPAATVTAPPGQAAPTNTGMCLEFY